MKVYSKYIMDHWAMIGMHILLGGICFFVADSALDVLLLAPVMLYAYSAVAIDIEQSGYALLVIISDEPDIDVAKRLSIELVDEAGRDVKTVLICGESLDELRERLEEAEEPEEDE